MEDAFAYLVIRMPKTISNEEFRAFQMGLLHELRLDSPAKQLKPADFDQPIDSQTVRSVVEKLAECYGGKAFAIRVAARLNDSRQWEVDVDLKKVMTVVQVVKDEMVLPSEPLQLTIKKFVTEEWEDTYTDIAHLRQSSWGAQLCGRPEINGALDWRKALNSKQASQIKNVLRDGFIPNDLKKNISIIGSDGEKRTESHVGVLLTDNAVDQDAEYFTVADKLLKAGAPLPAALLSRSDFPRTYDYFRHLVRSAGELFIALRKDSRIIREQDELGYSLLHHAALIVPSAEEKSDHPSLILKLLFNAPGIDFSVKDTYGSTPVHLAAYMTGNRVTSELIFPMFVAQAAKAGFDFSMLNRGGQGVIHLVARTDYKERIEGSGRVDNNVQKLLKLVPQIDLNLLTAWGATAYYCALDVLKLDNANTLLNAGADPMLYGKPVRNPLDKINEWIQEDERRLSLPTAMAPGLTESVRDRIKSNLAKLDSLKERMLHVYRA
jgi:hypothetical protein